MSISIGEMLRSRMTSENLKDVLKKDGAQYQKDWAQAVQFFQIAINKDRKRENLKLLPFIVIRQKLIAVREISDLQWFYIECLKYSRKKGNSFSKCFFGATKIK